MNVTDFGPWIDGQDCTATLVAALAMAGQAKQVTDRVVYIPGMPDPNGGVQINAWASGSSGTPIYVPSGVTVRGAGNQTHLTVTPNAALFGVSGSYAVFSTSGTTSNVLLRDFQLDCSRPAIRLFSSTVRANIVGASGIYLGPGATNCTVENVTIHDLFTVETGTTSNEGFAFFAAGPTTTPAMTGIIFRNCTAYNIDGTGFHVAGSATGLGGATPEWFTQYCAVIDCNSNNNTWQGVSVYVSQYVQVLGGQYNTNGKRGVNTEWSDNVVIGGGVFAQNNGEEGIGSAGYCTNLRIIGAVTYQNNTASTNSPVAAEIGFDTGTLGSQTAYLGDATIAGCVVVPIVKSGAPLGHVEAMERNTTPTTGFASAPNKITIETPGLDSWNIFANVSPYGAQYAPNSVWINAAVAGTAVSLGHLSTWTTSNASFTAPSGGNLNANAETVNIAASTNGYITPSGLSAGPGVKVKVHYRIKILDTNASWYVALFNGVGIVRQINLPNTANDIGVWFEGEMIGVQPISRTDSAVLRIGANNSSASTSQVVVDYIAATYLESYGTLSGV